MPVEVEPSYALDANPTLWNDVRRMLDKGWRRPSASFDAFKQRIWAANDELVTKVLCGE